MMDETLDIFNFKAVELLENLGYFMPDQKAIDTVEGFLKRNQALRNKPGILNLNSDISNNFENNFNF